MTRPARHGRHHVSDRTGTDRPARRGREQTIRVVFVPDYAGNPYLKLLDSALGEQGVEVRRCSDLDAVQGGGDPPDVVHLHWERFRTVHPSRATAARRSVDLVWTLVGLRRRGVLIVWTIHNLRDHEAPHPVLERVAQVALSRVAHRLVVHYPRAVDHARRRLLLSSRRFAVMPHGPYATTDVSRADARRALGLSPDAIVLSSVGFVRPYKRIPELIEAVRSLDHRFVLIIAGQPLADEEQRVRSAAGGDERIRLRLIRQSDLDLSRVLSASDAFVLPSDRQFSSGSALLAMGHGCALVAGESDHVRYLAGDAGARFFAPGASVQSMAETLGSLDREQVRRMGRHNASRAASFSWSSAAAILKEIYVGGA